MHTKAGKQVTNMGPSRLRASMPTRFQAVPWLVLFALLLVPLAACGQISPRVGDTIELEATSHLGVPLHSRPEPTDDFQRVADGARANVLEVRPDGRFLRIRVLPDGPEGWIVPKYVLRVVTGSAPVTTPAPPQTGGAGEREAEIWASPQSCATALAAKARMRRELSNPLVVGAWNIRFFPRGCPSEEDCPGNATELDWLACTIAWMGLDVLGLQEFLDTGDARLALAQVTARLNTLTGGAWENDLQSCGPASSQKVGFLWNASRVKLTNRGDEEQLNGAFDGNDACAANLRPGRYARVKSTKPGGADFHLLTVHLDSGRGEKDYQNRRRAIAELPKLAIGGRPLTQIGDPPGGGDDDILVVGDWNTMGQGAPQPVTEEEEIALFDRELSPGFRRLPASHGCSEYFLPEGATAFRAGLLDHLVPAVGMEEAASTVRVSGYCAILACQPFTHPPKAFERLSDHCPLVVEVRDEDIVD